MRLTFAGRSVVALAAMPPAALDLGALERAAGLDRATTQVVNPQMAMADYGRVRILVVPDGRVQLEIQPKAARDVARRTATEVVRQAAVYAPRAVGFNGVVRIEIDEGDPDPVLSLVNDNA
jgi:hypothetical protein